MRQVEEMIIQENTTGETSTGEHHLSPPAIALPKGGGAIRGMDEKFAANPVTGTGRHVDVSPVGARLGGARAGVPGARSTRSLQKFFATFTQILLFPYDFYSRACHLLWHAEGYN